MCRSLAPIVLVCSLCLSCAGTFGPGRVAAQSERAAAAAPGEVAAPLPPTDPRCKSLDDAHATWSALAIAGASVTGASGIGTIALDDRDQAAKIAVGVTALAVGAFTAFASAEAAGIATAYARECSQ